MNLDEKLETYCFKRSTNEAFNSLRPNSHQSAFLGMQGCRFGMRTFTYKRTRKAWRVVEPTWWRFSGP